MNKDVKLRYSLLSKKCPLEIKFILQEKPIEAFPPDETARGQQLHQLMAEAIDNKEFALINAETKQQAEKTFDPIFKQYEKFETEKQGKFETENETIGYHIDLMARKGNDILIVDFKSSYYAQLLPEYEKQLKYYAYAVLDTNPAHIVKTAIYVLSSNVLEYSETYMQSDMELLRKMIKQDINRVKKMDLASIDEFQPIVSKMCSYCGYPRSCPAYSDEILDNPEKIIQELVKAEARVKQLRQLGKEAVKRQGKAIIVDTYSASYENVDKYIIDNAPGLFEYLQTNKIDVFAIFKPSLTTFKKLASMREELFNFSSVKTSQKFVLKNLDKTEKGEEQDE